MAISPAKAVSRVICIGGTSIAILCYRLPLAVANPVVTFGFSTSATGTAPFTSGGGTNGNDNSQNNDIVRTYDVITYAWDYGVNQEDVINGVFAATISADQEWVNLPPACKTGSNIVTNVDGTQTLTCNVGTIDKASTGKLEANARIIGQRRAPIGDFVENDDIATATGNFNGDNITLQTDNPVDTTISSTPKADLRKPRAFVEGLQASRDGTTDGIVIRYPVNIRIGDGKGSEPLDPPGGVITITDDVSEMVPGAELYNWDGRGDCGWLGEPGKNRLRYNGFPWGRINTGQPDNESVTDSGDWSCSQSTPGEDITIQITDPDTTGNHIPDTAYNGTALSAEDRYLISGVIRIWVPVQPILDNGGSIVTKNCLSDLDVPGVSGQTNQDPETPRNSNNSFNNNISNNCYAFELIAGRGNFNQYYSRSVDERNQVLFPMAALNSGDGVVMPTQNFAKRLRGRNSGILDWENYIYCEKFDNQTHELVSIPGDPTTAVKVFNSGISASEYVIEYGTGNYGDYTAQRTATCEDADSPNGWFTDLTNPPPGVSTDDITKIRFRMLPGETIKPNEVMDLAVNFAARNEFPGTTNKIPNGTILANHSAYHTDQLNNGNWRVGNYNPETHGGGKSFGDRLALTRAIARINKETAPEDNEITSISAGESVTFKLIPTLTATVDPPPVTPVVKIIDKLPQYLSYVEDSANIAPTNIINNPDNTTTLEWDLGAQTPNQALPEITFDASADLDAPNNISVVNTAIAESPDDFSTETARSDTRTVTIGNLAAFRIFKQTEESSINQNGNITYYLNFANTGSSNLGVGEFIDILPHTNDGRNPVTNFTGDFKILSVNGDNGETFEYTVQDPENINPDPEDSSHKSFGETLLPGDTLWCSEAQFGNSGCPSTPGNFDDVTAVRIFTPSFPQATPTRRVTIVLDTENNQPENAYTNEFSGRIDGLIGFLTSPASSVTVNTPANLVLVKRITAINRGLDNEQVFDNTYVDDGDSRDNEQGWPNPIDGNSGISTYLSGVENNQVRPGDEVEYTVYFLANGDFDVLNATICDVLMQNNDIGEFVEDSFGNNQGIVLHFGDKPTNPNDFIQSAVTNLSDSDRGEFIAPGFAAPKACNSSLFGGDFSTPLPGTQNQSGSVVVNLNRISHVGNNSLGSTDPYGLIRFRIKID